jgi:glutamyl-tRNA synthetase
MSAPVVRFAPSPTGYIHLGNARTALLNWCFAKSQGGRFILRFDDTDHERSRPEYAHAIVADLAWLGLMPDVTVSQSDRLDVYAAAAERLKDAGRLYPCYETEEELDRRRRLARASGRPPVYDRSALRLGEADRARLEAEGRHPHWRFLLEYVAADWDDLVRGAQHIPAGGLSDPVLLREDGQPLYTFTSVVDDAEMGVTHIIRGEDHVTNTAVQLQLFAALGVAAPVFAHHNLLTSATGAGLSKREGSLSLAALREDGYEGAAVAALATLVGSAEAVRPVRHLDELAGLIDLAKLSRAPARVDEDELATLNARTVHELGFADVADRLGTLGVGGGEAFWLAVRGNLARVADCARGCGARCRGPAPPAARTVGRHNLARLDGCGQSRDGPQGARSFPSATPGADRAGLRPGTRVFPALYRGGAYTPPASRLSWEGGSVSGAVSST